MLKGTHHKAESIKKMSKVQKDRHADPAIREMYSKSMKKYYEDNPEARLEASEQLKEYYSDPKHLEEHVIRRRKYFVDHPEARELSRQTIKKTLKADPELPKRAAAARIKKYGRKSNLPDVIEI